jgi:hypothetical protein
MMLNAAVVCQFHSRDYERDQWGVGDGRGDAQYFPNGNI